MTRIDLDANATTPLLPEAWEAMRHSLLEDSGNPSSAHAAGRKARQALEAARETVARCLDCRPDEVIFTSGATEANNLAVFGLAGEPPGHLVTSPIEHPCVVEPIAHLERRGCAVFRAGVDPVGRIRVNELMSAVRPDTRLIALMLVNHETGAMQPVAEVAAKSAVPVHTDAAQAVGKIPVSFRSLGAATLSLSAHKFRGPPGIGALIVRNGVRLKPMLFGGHQQRGLRPGTEPAALAVGLATALDHAVARLAESHAILRQRRAWLWKQLVERCSPVVLNGPPIDSPDGVPGTLNVSFPGCRADLLLMALDLAGVNCSTGSACSSGSLLPSPVIAAMGVPDVVLRSALRFSFSATLTDIDWNHTADRIASAVCAQRGGSR